MCGQAQEIFWNIVGGFRAIGDINILDKIQIMVIIIIIKKNIPNLFDGEKILPPGCFGIFEKIKIKTIIYYIEITQNTKLNVVWSLINIICILSNMRDFLQSVVIFLRCARYFIYLLKYFCNICQILKF